jgi:DNA-directed RNA polymerase subunit F
MGREVGRATKYTEDLANKICEILSTTSRSLRSICMEPNMPSHASVYTWLNEKPSFLDKYTRARESQADYMADEILEIADDSSEDTRTIVKDGEIIEVENADYINRCKLRIESRKWVAAKLRPKKYGDKVDIDYTTKGDKVIGEVDYSRLSDEVLQQIINAKKE